MVAFGIVELIVLLLGLAGIGLTPNPKPVTPDQALAYAVADADAVIHVDVASIVPNNFKALKALPTQPAIKGSPEFAKEVSRAVLELEGMRAMVVAKVGLDPVSDITDATVFVKFVSPRRDPEFLATARGTITPVIMENLSKTTKRPAQKIGAGLMIEADRDDPSIGLTKDNVLLLGSPSLVRERLAGSWKSPPRGGALGWAQEAIAARPVFAVAISLSQAARRELAQSTKKSFPADLAARHKGMALALYHDGIGWSWGDSSKAGLDQMGLLSEGVLETLRAFHIAPRGVAKIALASLESYRGTSRQIDDLIARKADVLKIIDSYTGDGNFKISVNKDQAKLRLDVRATGKSLSDVLPASALLPGVAFLMLGRGVTKTSVQTSPSPPPMVRPVPDKAPKLATPAR